MALVAITTLPTYAHTRPVAITIPSNISRVIQRAAGGEKSRLASSDRAGWLFCLSSHEKEDCYALDVHDVNAFVCLTAWMQEWTRAPSLVSPSRHRNQDDRTTSVDCAKSYEIDY